MAKPFVLKNVIFSQASITAELHNSKVHVLWCQPIKLIQVVSTSEFHEY